MSDSKFYITIGRQHGCGGRIVGADLAERIGVNYYDRDTVTDLIAEDCGLTPEAVAGLMERRTSSLLYEMATLGQTNPLEEQVFISKTRIVNRLADEGSFVIVGVCGYYILRERENLLKVFLYGDPKNRIDRIVNVYHDTDYMSEQQLKGMDRSRADYYRFFTSYKWGNRNNYDILLNTDVGLKEVTDMLELISRERFGGLS